jgi:hypothetical protein
MCSRAARTASSSKSWGLVDYLADRFAFAGAPAERIKTLERAVEAGARRFWISIHFDDKLRFMRDWAEQVMPAFR